MEELGNDMINDVKKEIYEHMIADITDEDFFDIFLPLISKSRNARLMKKIYIKYMRGGI